MYKYSETHGYYLTSVSVSVELTGKREGIDRLQQKLGSLWAWGSNQSGRLGDGTATTPCDSAEFIMGNVMIGILSVGDCTNLRVNSFQNFTKKVQTTNGGGKIRIIPESERKLMSRKDIDFEFDGCGVLYDYKAFYPKDLGYVVAVSDGTRDDWVEEIYWN